MRRTLLISSLTLLLIACGDDDPVPVEDTSANTSNDGDAATTGGDPGDPPDDEGATGDDSGGTDDTSDGDATGTGESEQEAITSIPLIEGEDWEFVGLKDEVIVVRTELGRPHVYAKNRVDMFRVLGFVVARDRYFIMDLQRRLGLGTVAELFGDRGYDIDLESRWQGITYVAERLEANMNPEMGELMDAFAEGMNDYIAAVAAKKVPAPTELAIGGAILGADKPTDLMEPWDRKSLAAAAAVILYRFNYETDDIGRTAKAAKLATAFEGVEDAELRNAGFKQDIWDNVAPLFGNTSSTPGFGLDTTSTPPAGKPGAADMSLPQSLPVETGALNRAIQRTQHIQDLLMRDREKGFGSNTWAVMGDKTTNGAALVANDGHLELSVPALFYQVGMDTVTFGSDDETTRQAGLLLSGMPVLAVGTNGKVAWGGVNPVADITDWYREEIKLDENGAPKSSKFQGNDEPLVAKDETFSVAGVFDSVERTETWIRYTTFDGRWIMSIEGETVKADHVAGPGETVVSVNADFVVPKDMDNDGVITAISFDYTGLDMTDWIGAQDRLGHAEDMWEFREHTKGMVGSALFTAAADSQGSVLFSAYQTFPCRGYLMKDGEGNWMPGSNPKQLLDGTVYGAFTMPSKDGIVDEEPGKTDPYQCVIPFEDVPQALDPEAGFVFNANNDPAAITEDGNFFNDKWHIGGPWASVRASSIKNFLSDCTADKSCDEDAMAELQAHRKSRLGELFAPTLVEAIGAAKALSETDGDKGVDDARLVALYDNNKADFDAVSDRLVAWGEAGYDTPSGVETFYDNPTSADKVNAVATMIYNAWQGRFIASVWNDEPVPGWRHSGSREQVRALKRYLDGRGADNPEGHAAWNEATQEAVFFDVVGTPEVERSRELMLKALEAALIYLKAEPEGPGVGGFGTDDMSQWLWGLRHQVRFESLLGGFLGDDPDLAFVSKVFSINTGRLPLADDIGPDDPRKGLEWFPRGGDQWSVDAGNPGFSGTKYTYGSGPVMRMVIALKDGEVSGRNIIPGGQSGLTSSPHFVDQAEMWLGNQTVPLRFTPAQVAEGAVGREMYRPKASE